MGFNWPKDKLSSESVRTAIRQNILEQIHLAKSGHPGGSLSMVELLTAIFDGNFEQKVQDPEWAERDRFILSKGHGVPTLYSVYSYLGYFEASETKNLRKLNHFLQGHPDRLRFPLMEASTGSLGQGVSVALGLAMGLKLKFDAGEIKRLPKVYCVLGDGEFQEGQVWEALMATGKFAPQNLMFILDYNKGQIDGPTNEVMNLEPVMDKVKAFNLDVTQVDGHDVDALSKYFASWNPENEKSSKFLIADTVKGKGVDFMEHNIQWHGSAPSTEDLQKAYSAFYPNASDDNYPNGSMINFKES